MSVPGSIPTHKLFINRKVDSFFPRVEQLSPGQYIYPFSTHPSNNSEINIL